MDDVGQVGTSQRVCGVRLTGDPRDAKVGHHILPAWDGVPPRRLDYAFVTEFISVGNSTNQQIFQFFQYLSAAAPQVKPPPIASSTTMSPRLIRPSRTAVSSASGTEAADVLACWSTVTTTLSGSSPSFLAVASRMRLLA